MSTRKCDSFLALAQTLCPTTHVQRQRPARSSEACREQELWQKSACEGGRRNEAMDPCLCSPGIVDAGPRTGRLHRARQHGERDGREYRQGARERSCP